jgi:DICT domain-containing protein
VEVFALNLDMSVVSIGELSQRTGVKVSTLRAWEARHGFPDARRLPGRHRRYTERDVLAVLAVVNARKAGAPLHSAIERARSRDDARRASIFATMRAAMPDIHPIVLTQHDMRALSHAIEDEVLIRAEQPVLIGAFQRTGFERVATARWTELAMTSYATLALGGFRAVRQTGNLIEVPIPHDAPTVRQWAVICDSPTYAACLVGIEQVAPRPARHGVRRYEAMWTTEAHVVREAAKTGVAIAAEHAGGRAAAAAQRLATSPLPEALMSARQTTSMSNRVLARIFASRAAGARARPA